MITLQDVLRKLTDVFTKSPESNIGKLFMIMTGQLQDVESTLNRISEWHDINLAQGTTLDRIGDNVGQARGVATDEIFRILIKSKIARNLSTADINTIIRVLAVALDADYSEIRIKEKYNDPVDPEPAAISVVQVPIARLNEIGMDLRQFGRIVKKTVAAGVRVDIIELEGTFQFADDLTLVEDIEHGMSDLTGTEGGYLGAAFSPDGEDLPI